MYCIRSDYKHRETIQHHDDRKFTDSYQDYVYSLASQYADEKDVILDIGCGSGFKLMKYFSDHKTIGTEMNPALNYLHQTYPDRDWREPQEFFEGKVDIVICSDVIEHVAQPAKFLTLLRSIPCKFLIISTPDRNLLDVRDGFSFGPPKNPCHYREWSKQEFSHFLSRMGFHIIESQENKEESGQVHVCQ